MKPLFENHNTDKLLSDYIEKYENILIPFLDKDIRLLELGVFNGGSLFMWRDYFSKGIICGLDLNDIKIEDYTGRIKLYKGSQDDVQLLEQIAKENAPQKFDIIIDDCAHVGEIAKRSYRYLFDNHLKSGGIYVIEDWGTGYWPIWSDGEYYNTEEFNKSSSEKDKKRIKSHDYGMVGFLKELIDEVGIADITHEKYGKPPVQTSQIREIRIFPGIAFVVKN